MVPGQHGGAWELLQSPCRRQAAHMCILLQHYGQQAWRLIHNLAEFRQAISSLQGRGSPAEGGACVLLTPPLPAPLLLESVRR